VPCPDAADTECATAELGHARQLELTFAAEQDEQDEAREQGDMPQPRKPWAWLLRHVFQADLEHCPRCNGDMRWVHAATTSKDITRLPRAQAGGRWSLAIAPEPSSPCPGAGVAGRRTSAWGSRHDVRGPLFSVRLPLALRVWRGLRARGPGRAAARFTGELALEKQSATTWSIVRARTIRRSERRRSPGHAAADVG